MPRKLKTQDSEKEAEIVVEEATPQVAARMTVDESSKAELLWLLGELQRLGIRSISDLENLVARTPR